MALNKFTHRGLREIINGALSAAINAVKTTADGSLPLAGGTMTGPINMGSQAITAAGAIGCASVTATADVGAATATITGLTQLASMRFGAAGPVFITGTGSPEGAETAVTGSLYVDDGGGADSTLWAKETGSGNTGWAAMAGI